MYQRSCKGQKFLNIWLGRENLERVSFLMLASNNYYYNIKQGEYGQYLLSSEKINLLGFLQYVQLYNCDYLRSCQLNYVLAYKDSTQSNWDSVIVSNNGFSTQVYNLNGLTSLTTYNWRVKCDTSWVYGPNFTTNSIFNFTFSVTDASCSGSKQTGLCIFFYENVNVMSNLENWNTHNTCTTLFGSDRSPRRGNLVCLCVCV